MPPDKHRSTSNIGSNHHNDKPKDGRQQRDENHHKKDDPPRRDRDHEKEKGARRASDRLNMLPPPAPRARDEGNKGSRGQPPWRSHSCSPPRQSRHEEPRRSRSNHGSAREKTHISDAHTRIEEIKVAREESYFGPKCFGPAIQKVQLPSSLGNVKKIANKYKSYDNPDTWLPDYIHTVGINEGDYSAAVHFLPLVIVHVQCTF